MPISEDLMLFIAGILAAQHPSYTLPLFLSVFIGAYISDLICYTLFGRFLGQKIFETKFFSKQRRLKKLKTIEHFYTRYGMSTLFFGRFIPFGVRNALFISAGLSKMNAWRFALTDFFSCAISSISYFWLYKTYGNSVIPYIKRMNMIVLIFFILFAIAAFLFFRSKYNLK